MCSLRILVWSFIQLALILVQSHTIHLRKTTVYFFFVRSTVFNWECQSLKGKHTDWIQSHTFHTTKDLFHSPKVSKPAHVHIVSPLGRTNDLRHNVDRIQLHSPKFRRTRKDRTRRRTLWPPLDSSPHRNFTCCLCSTALHKSEKHVLIVRCITPDYVSLLLLGHIASSAGMPTQQS